MSAGFFVTVPASPVAVSLAHTIAGARLGIAFMRRAAAAPTDDTALGNLVMFRKKITSLKITLIQPVGELVRRTTQKMSLPPRGWHELFRGLSPPVRGGSLLFPRSRASASGSS